MRREIVNGHGMATASGSSLAPPTKSGRYGRRLSQCLAPMFDFTFVLLIMFSSNQCALSVPASLSWW